MITTQCSIKIKMYFKGPMRWSSVFFNKEITAHHFKIEMKS